MPQSFEFHEVADRLFVGPCPDSPERIKALRQQGINALVCVQTDRDLEALGLTWALLWRFLMAQGISAERKPITDFDDISLVQGLPDAVAAVQSMHAGGRSVYLHCTAGLNRSPTVAIAWLVAHQGLNLDAAWAQVSTRRSVVPNRTALIHWQLRRNT